MTDLNKLRAEYEWERVDSLTDILTATAGKTVAAATSEETGGMDDYGDHVHAVVFTDGTGFACHLDGGWTGTDVTPGEPAEVIYYALRRKES